MFVIFNSAFFYILKEFDSLTFSEKTANKMDVTRQRETGTRGRDSSILIWKRENFRIHRIHRIKQEGKGRQQQTNGQSLENAATGANSKTKHKSN